MPIPQTMSGVVLPGDRGLEIRQFEVPTPGPREVLIGIKASSLCGSDLRAIYRPTNQGSGPEAYKGVIAGHEPCGQIVAVGEDVTRFHVGERVVAYHIAGCGACEACRSGWMIGCHSEAREAYGWQRNGGHAPFMLAQERTLVPLPDELTYLDGAMVACGFGTAYAACLRAQISGRDEVLITGLGPVGLGTALVARALGGRVAAVEGNAERVQLANQLGFANIVAPDENASENLMNLTQGKGYEVAIDCSGVSAARHLCLEAARDWGSVVYVGEGGTVTFEPSPLLLHKQLTLHGSWVCSIGQMEELIEKLVAWNLHPECIVTHKFGLEQAREAYEIFDSGQSGKVAIVWED